LALITQTQKGVKTKVESRLVEKLKEVLIRNMIKLT